MLKEPGSNSEITCHMKYATLISSTLGADLKGNLQHGCPESSKNKYIPEILKRHSHLQNHDFPVYLPWTHTKRKSCLGSINHNALSSLYPFFLCELAYNQINIFGTKLLLRKFNVQKLAKNDATLSHFDT
jgi:hypothetical protein